MLPDVPQSSSKKRTRRGRRRKKAPVPHGKTLPTPGVPQPALTTNRQALARLLRSRSLRVAAPSLTDTETDDMTDRTES